MPGIRLNGMDVLEVKEATREASDHVRSGKGPIFIEAQTYRFRGHSIADPAEYRRGVEVEDWLEKDPIVAFKRKLLDEGQASEQELTDIDGAVMKEIEEAAQIRRRQPLS